MNDGDISSFRKKISDACPIDTKLVNKYINIYINIL